MTNLAILTIAGLFILAVGMLMGFILGRHYAFYQKRNQSRMINELSMKRHRDRENEIITEALSTSHADENKHGH